MELVRLGSCGLAHHTPVLVKPHIRFRRIRSPHGHLPPSLKFFKIETLDQTAMLDDADYRHLLLTPLNMAYPGLPTR